MGPLSVSGTVTIAAPPETIFAILADPRQHARIDGSGSVRGLITGPERLSLGTEFGIRMRIGAPYRMRNRVVEFEEGRLIAWRHFGAHRWRYHLEPIADGTRVTETWDATRYPRPWQFLFRAVRYPQRNQRGIDATLVKLKEAAEGA